MAIIDVKTRMTRKKKTMPHVRKSITKHQYLQYINYIWGINIIIKTSISQSIFISNMICFCLDQIHVDQNTERKISQVK